MLIDLNADLGEGAGTDADLVPLVTSVNVCCGLHAGGPSEARTTLELAKAAGAAVGAHPGYADREHFGRRELTLPAVAVFDLCVYQIGALVALAKAAGVAVRYVKPHGALYNRACRDGETADPVVAAAAEFGLPLVGLPASTLEAAANAARVPYFAEGFVDRRYRPDGSLVPRSEPDAFITDAAEAVAQATRLVRERGVRTMCVHGDSPEAVAFARVVRQAFEDEGFRLTPFA